MGNEREFLAGLLGALKGSECPDAERMRDGHMSIEEGRKMAFEEAGLYSLKIGALAYLLTDKEYEHALLEAGRKHKTWLKENALESPATEEELAALKVIKEGVLKKLRQRQRRPTITEKA